MRPLALVLLLAAAPAAGTKLRIGDRADAAAAEDLNGDGFPDLVVQSGLDLRVFHFRRDEGFRPDADAVLRLDPRTFLWCFARFGDAKTRCIATTTSRGIHRYVAADGAFLKLPEDLVIHPSLFEGACGEGKAPAHVRFMQDLDGDGLDDALLFTSDEILYLPQRTSGGRPSFRLKQRIDIPIESVLFLGWAPHMKVIETVQVPLLAFADLNGDKRTDIGYYRDEAIGMFTQKEDGSFDSADPRDLATKKRKPRNTYLKFEAPPRIGDLNADGLADIAITYPSKGRVQVYFNRAGRTDFTTPDDTLEIDGWSTGIYAVDLDGDGKVEIVMGVVRKFGIMGGIDLFTTKKVKLELLVFKLRENGRYTNDPVQSLEFSIPYTLQASRESVQLDLVFRPNFEADLDGDGRRDLLVEKDGRAFSVYPGVADKFIADKPDREVGLDVPANVAFMRASAWDFNGDRKSDLVVRYRVVDQKKDEVEVILSK
jgi:hypothetical protein